MPLILILFECGIELIPKNIRDHPAVKKNFSSRIYSSQLLDNTLHFSAMKNLRNREKRGRPDITHSCLLNALGSPLNNNGNLKLYIHTINGKIFEFNPEIRIARNYNRFKGLMAKMLIDGSIVTENLKLISSFKGTLKDLIDKFNTTKVYLFSSKGSLINDYKQLFTEDILTNYVTIIGGFQKSSFSKNILNLSENLISISKYPLDAWVVTNRIITYYELTYGIL
ncbi:MAG: 16S rRNA methyltransferase [Promethearchaeota archaeon]|nr:MAG: 16S rRNA methyltransferase [Candidatus Lokiarchaeota archaeon]